MSKGDFESRDLDDLAVLDAPAGEEQQLIVRTVGDPDVAILGDADPHQAVEFLLEGEVRLGRDRLAVEIHDQDLAVEAGGPNPVAGHRGPPADPVDSHAGKAGDRRRERRSVRGHLEDAAAEAFDHAGLRTGHPVLPAPQVAVRVEHEAAVGVHPAAGEGEHEGEVVGRPEEIGREGRGPAGAVLRLRIGLVEQGEKVLRVGPRLAGDVRHRLKSVRGRVASG